MRALETLVLLVLLLAFFILSWQAVEKYLTYDTTFIEKRTKRTDILYPGITFCPGLGDNEGFLSNHTSAYKTFDLEEVNTGAEYLTGDELDPFISYPVLATGTSLGVCIRVELKQRKQPGFDNGVGKCPSLCHDIFNKFLLIFILI